MRQARPPCEARACLAYVGLWHRVGRTPKGEEDVYKRQDATYEWHSRIEDAPDRFRFLSDPGSLLIRRIRSKELPFELTLRDLCGEPIDEQRLTSAETEKLEAFLIATPEVIYTGDLEYFSECKEES